MNILIVSYVYAPDRSPRAYRWSALAEHWCRQGHRVDVISGWKHGDERIERRSGVTINRVGGGIVERLRGMLGQSSHRIAETQPAIREAAPLLRRAAKALYVGTLRKLYWPDYAFHWYPAALARGRTLCRQTRYDAMISVSHPFTPHLVGLALKLQLPALRWLVDIGDPFSLLEEIPLNNVTLYRRLNRRAEAAVLHRADSIAVTVERCRRDVVAAFPASAGKVAVIPPLLSLPPAAAPASALFAEGETHLVFIGTLYRALRDPSDLLALFRELHRQRGDLHLHFFGALNDCAPCFDRLEEDLATKIHCHGVVSRAMTASAMRDADVLINIGNVTAHQLPSKLVEYAAAARPILNLASTAEDTASGFLAGHPAALTLKSRAAPDHRTIKAALAFIAAPPPIPLVAIEQFLKPYRLDTIAVDYFRLLTPTPAR